MITEEIKPCLFCGREGTENGPKCSIDGQWGCDFCCEYEHDGMNISWETAQNAWAHKRIEQLLKERDEALAKADQYREELMQMVAQHCHSDRKEFDLESFCLSTNADAMRLLGKNGDIEIEDRGMRVVFGKWKKAEAQKIMAGRGEK